MALLYNLCQEMRHGFFEVGDFQHECVEQDEAHEFIAALFVPFGLFV